MKKVLVLVMAVALTILCFAGCSGGMLTEKDFGIYKDGEEIKHPDKSEIQIVVLGEDEETARGIKLGDSSEVAKEAYPNMKAEYIKVSNDIYKIWLYDKRGYRLEFDFENEKLRNCSSQTKAMADVSDEGLPDFLVVEQIKWE